METPKKSESQPVANTNARFEDTRWTEVVDLASDATSARGAAALEELCRTYWPPIYASLRRGGYSVSEAQDLSQGFFTHLLQADRLARPSRAQGRFRSWLLKCLKHYTCNQIDHQAAAMRKPLGGLISVEDLAHQEQLLGTLVMTGDGDEVFDAAFAHQLVDSVLNELRSEYIARGKVALCRELINYLTDTLPGEKVDQIGTALGMKPTAVRVAHSRLKDRFAEILRCRVRSLVIDSADVDAELRHLMNAWVKSMPSS